jgi:hypothetical protein
MYNQSVSKNARHFAKLRAFVSREVSIAVIFLNGLAREQEMTGMVLTGCGAKRKVSSQEQ